MRVFRDCLEMIKEVDRDLFQNGLSVPIKHYQNVKLYGEDQITKELMGVSFTISKPLENRREMMDYIFKDQAQNIEEYCIQEFEDRTCGQALNPGNSYKIRLDLWQALMSHDQEKVDKFDYTYSERYCKDNQLENLIETLKEDKHSRQAILQVYQSDLDTGKQGGNTRIPCSVDYQIMIRNNRVYCIYHMRSNDLLNHMCVDIWLSAELIKFITDKLKPIYPDIKTGSLIYFAGSLHAYNWDLKKRVIF